MIENGFIDAPERQCKGKAGYGTKAKAKRAGRRANLRISVYRCPHCDLFHLGHRR